MRIMYMDILYECQFVVLKYNHDHNHYYLKMKSPVFDKEININLNEEKRNYWRMQNNVNRFNTRLLKFGYMDLDEFLKGDV